MLHADDVTARLLFLRAPENVPHSGLGTRNVIQTLDEEVGGYMRTTGEQRMASGAGLNGEQRTKDDWT